MQPKHLMAGAVLALLSAEARAAPVTFLFTGTVTNLTDSAAFSELHFGDHVHGSYTFDGAAAPEIFSGGNLFLTGFYQYPSAGAPFGITLSVGAEVATFSDFRIEITNDDIAHSEPDRYRLFTPDNAARTFDILLGSLLTSPLKSTSDPLTPPPLAEFFDHQGRYTKVIGARREQLTFNIDSLTPPPAPPKATIPEPGSLVLFGFSLYVLSLSRASAKASVRSRTVSAARRTISS